MNDEIYCKRCGWQGLMEELVTEDPEDTPVEDCKFDHCPTCGSTDTSEMD